jgi:hypothetical protein
MPAHALEAGLIEGLKKGRDLFDLFDVNLFIQACVKAGVSPNKIGELHNSAQEMFTTDPNMITQNIVAKALGSNDVMIPPVTTVLREYAKAYDESVAVQTASEVAMRS